MKRFTFAVFALAVFSASAFAADCAKDYSDFWTKIDREQFEKLSGAQIADLVRTTLRIYDSCAAGDERFSATNLYKQLDAEHYSKASDIFSSGAFDPPEPVRHRRRNRLTREGEVGYGLPGLVAPELLRHSLLAHGASIVSGVGPGSPRCRPWRRQRASPRDASLDRPHGPF